MREPRPVADQLARDRIVRELDRNLLVEAGAGSGKTQKLAERMTAGVASGAYELEGLAAVTFTRKAAAELRGRFQIALEAELTLALSGPDASEARARRCRDALGKLERFFAGTIHAFCARLLRERPVEAGVSPGFTELDDEDERLLRQQSWRDYRGQARAAGDPDLLELLDAGITAKQLDGAFETVCLYEDVEFPQGSATSPDVARVWEELDAFWSTLRSMLPAAVDEDHTCSTITRAHRFEREWRAAGRGRRDAALLANLCRVWESNPGVVQKWWHDKKVAKAAAQLHADFREATVLPFLSGWRRYLYGRCIALLTRGREAAKRERLRRNSLSFNDLLLMTAGVLRRNADVRHALQRKYRWLLVDEFQDTDPVQAEIMFLLASEPGDEADWRKVTLRPGALFVVGDPKQSIYRFRRADIDIYSEVRRRLAGDDGSGVVRLTTNFRSVPALCEWANAVFRDLFPADPTSERPAFAPLDPHRAPARDLPDVAVIEIPESLEPNEVAADEAGRIARWIRGEVDAGRRTYGDSLVLTRRKRGLRPIASALEALDVPIEVTGAGAFDESDEVRAISLLLLAIADPQDAVALIGVLRGSLFGLSDRDLFAFRQAGGYFSLFCEIDEAGAPDAARRVAAAMSQLRRWHGWTRRLPVGAALERILDDSGYLALAATSRGGVEAGDLLHAVDRLRSVVERGFTLAEAADALSDWCGLDEEPRDSSEVDSLPLEPGRPDVVRVMNLHKAKGLEAPVVFLADPLGGYAARADVRIVRTAESGQALGYFRIEEESEHSWARKVLAEPEGWDAHEAAELRYVEAEIDRLFYVAATRAKDTVVISRPLGKEGKKGIAWGPLLASVAGVRVLSVPAPATSAPVSSPAPDPAGVPAAAASIAAAHERAAAASWSVAPVTGETRRLFPSAPATSEPADASDPTRVVVPDSPSHRADAGVEWGELVHGLLEHAMRHAAATRDDLRRLALWLTLDAPRLRPVIDLALDTVQEMQRSAVWLSARAAPERQEEMPFAVRDAADPSKVVTGVIDLVHRADAGWRIVDYKTDLEFEDTARQEKYARQVAQYARAWEKVTGGTVATEVVPARSGRA